MDEEYLRDVLRWLRAESSLSALPSMPLLRNELGAVPTEVSELDLAPVIPLPRVSAENG
ncbi:hypothetical protein [Amycolatopsis nigrescens]|uniref:hypothetical protein n=1 Tax=Amycolatopsis nigrescens TaxID=381445 RepID=UPI00036554AA|nr:hypothetical protein [Amycolatopsis nigrescens]